MKEEMVNWMNRHYPDGFYCADLTTTTTLSELNLPAAPLLLHLRESQLQDLVGHLIEQGVSPHTSCFLPEENISGKLGDVVLRTRNLNLHDLFLVIAE